MFCGEIKRCFYISVISYPCPTIKLSLLVITACIVSKYGNFSGPYIPVFGLEKTSYLEIFYAVY